MRNIPLLLALSLALFACGQKEKAENPFGRTNDPSREGGMTEREFREDCSRKNGLFTGASGEICYYVPYKFSLTKDMQEELLKNGLIRRQLGIVTRGSVLWGEVKGGQRVFFELNGQVYTHMNDGPLAQTAIDADGPLYIRIHAGAYERINAYVAQCFTRSEQSVACPIN